MAHSFICWRFMLFFLVRNYKSVFILIFFFFVFKLHDLSTILWSPVAKCLFDHKHDFLNNARITDFDVNNVLRDRLTDTHQNVYRKINTIKPNFKSNFFFTNESHQKWFVRAHHTARGIYSIENLHLCISFCSDSFGLSFFLVWEFHAPFFHSQPFHDDCNSFKWILFTLLNHVQLWWTNKRFSNYIG